MRNLEREIGNVCRKVARKVVNAQSGKDKKRAAKVVINGDKLPELLGPWKFRDLTGREEERSRAPPRVWPGPKSAARF